MAVKIEKLNSVCEETIYRYWISPLIAKNDNCEELIFLFV